MRYELKSKLLALVIAAALSAGLTCGCGSTPAASLESRSTQSSSGTAENAKYSDPLTIDLYTDLGIAMGEQTGWFGKIIKDKFNMTVNIISAQGGGSGETVFQTRSAAGNLGDIMFVDQNKASQSIQAGLVYDMTDIVDIHAEYYVKTFPKSIEKLKTAFNTDRVYAIPMQVSTQSPLDPQVDRGMPQYGAYTRLDYYQGIGSPEMKTLDDLLPMLQKMQEAYPKSDSGKTTYAFSFFKDWDGGCMQNAALFAYMYGWPRFQGTGFWNPETGESQSFIDDDGIYYKTLKMYYDANQLGLVDPDSATQNWDILNDKVKDGQVLFSWWSWLGIPGFNTAEHLAEGKGFAFVPIADQKIYNDGIPVNGTGVCAAIGSSAKDPERMMDFIGWLGSPEGNQAITAGPEGLTWTMENGEPVLTEFGKDAEALDKPVPEEYGGGTYAKGMWQGGVTVILINRGVEMNPETGFPYDSFIWPSTLEKGTQLDKNWQDEFKANTVMEYLEANNMTSIGIVSDWHAPEDTTEEHTQRQEISDAIANASWQMIFARNEDEFNSIWENAKETAKGLGFDTLYELDSGRAREAFAAAQEVVGEYDK